MLGIYSVKWFQAFVNGGEERKVHCVTQSIIGTYDDNIFWLRLKERMALIFYGVFQNWECSLLSAYATFITSLSLPDFFVEAFFLKGYLRCASTRVSDILIQNSPTL